MLLTAISTVAALCPGNGQGKLNSQFGTFWITDGIKNKKIKKGEQIPKNWKKGRYISYDKKTKKKLNLKCIICNIDTGGTQRKYCLNHKPKCHMEETIQKLRKKAILKVGELNNQYGTIWINNGIKNKKIKKNKKIPDNWKLGRFSKKENTLCNVCNCDTGSTSHRRCKEHRNIKTQSHRDNLRKRKLKK